MKGGAAEGLFDPRQRDFRIFLERVVIGVTLKIVGILGLCRHVEEAPILDKANRRPQHRQCLVSIKGHSRKPLLRSRVIMGEIIIMGIEILENTSCPILFSGSPSGTPLNRIEFHDQDSRTTASARLPSPEKVIPFRPRRRYPCGRS